MKNRITYFLVARNYTDNTFNIISPTSSWGLSQEEIDLYTMSYKTKDNLITSLLKSKKISSTNIDFFICYQTYENKRKVLKTNEVLFDSNSLLEEIAKTSLKSNIDLEKADYLLNYFSAKVKNNPKFYDKIIYGNTNIYSKFIRYYYNKRFIDNSFVKYKDGGWSRKSYNLLRNITETIISFDKGYLYESNINRSIIFPKLMILTDKNYNIAQPFLFEFWSDENERDGYQKQITKRIN